MAPHADDEVLGAGGAIQKHILDKDDVHVVVVCNRKGRKTKQQGQCVKACLLLGVPATNVYFLDMIDEKLDANSHDIIKSLEKIYNDVKPGVVYHCHHDDINTDHHAVATACDVITRRLQDDPPSMVLMYEVPSSTTQSSKKTFKPNLYYMLTETMLQNKIAAMQTYEDEMRKFPNPRCEKGIQTYAMFRGMEAGCEYAECYQVKYIIQ